MRSDHFWVIISKLKIASRLMQILIYRYLLEHGLQHDGKLDPEKKDLASEGSYDTFFTETGNGKYVPRSIFVDLDPSVREQALNLGKQISNERYSLSMKSALVTISTFSTRSSLSAARRMPPTTVRRYSWSNIAFIDNMIDARGHYTIGKELVDTVVDRIRRVAGMLMTHSRKLHEANTW
jgi:tubulin alpha